MATVPRVLPLARRVVAGSTRLEVAIWATRVIVRVTAPHAAAAANDQPKGARHEQQPDPVRLKEFHGSASAAYAASRSRRLVSNSSLLISPRA